MTNKKGTYQEELDRKFKPVYDYYELAHKWRGEVLNATISLEQQLELFITRYFIRAVTQEEAERKSEELMRFFMWNTQMGFDRKRHIVIDLINNYIPDFKKLNENVDDELLKIVQCRNSMAHWQLDYTNIFRWHGAALKQIKLNKLNKQNATIYSEDTIKEVIELANKYTTIFMFWSW